MGTKRVIIIVGDDQKKNDLIQTQIGSFLNKIDAKSKGVSWRNTKFVTTFNDCICKQFGLMHSYQAYVQEGQSWMDAEQQEFFGHVPSSVFAGLLDHYTHLFGSGFVGRALSRTIRFESVNNLFVLSDCPSHHDLRAVAFEVKPSNVMVLQVDNKKLDMPDHEKYTLKDMQVRTISTSDIELMRILVRGCVADFLSLEVPV